MKTQYKIINGRVVTDITGHLQDVKREQYALEYYQLTEEEIESQYKELQESEKIFWVTVCINKCDKK